MQEMWVRSLDWEDPLEEEMKTYSSILAWDLYIYSSSAFCCGFIEFLIMAEE